MIQLFSLVGSTVLLALSAKMLVELNKSIEEINEIKKDIQNKKEIEKTPNNDYDF